MLDSRGKKASKHLVRFIQQYALLAKIVHPHVIRIYDQGFSDEHASIAVEYFERSDLRSLFGPALTRRCAMRAIREIALALEAIHQSGIVHRGITLENIMLCADGSAALADVGIAKSMLQADGFGSTQTRHGDVVGTPWYLRPVQASGRKLTRQLDL